MSIERALACHNGMSEILAPVSSNTVVGWSLRVWDFAWACWLIDKLYDGTKFLLKDVDRELYSVKQIHP